MLNRYFPFALTAPTVIFAGVVTVGLLLLMKAGVAGLALAVPLAACFLRYCYLILDAILNGSQEPPALSADIVNVLGDRRPLFQALLLTAMVSLVVLTIQLTGFVYGALLAAFILFWAPASIAVLAVTGRPILALWPPQLMAYSRTCGHDHRKVRHVVLLLGALIFGLLRFAAPPWMVLSASLLMLLISFALVGGTLARHRKELGLSDLRAQREAERSASQITKLRERMLEVAYAKIKSGKPLDGWREIQNWMSQRGRGDNALPERKAVLAAAVKWSDPRPADRLADDLISIFLAQGDPKRALSMLEQRLTQNERFLPSSSHRTRLADLAVRAGKTGLHQKLLAVSRDAATQMMQRRQGLGRPAGAPAPRLAPRVAPSMAPRLRPSR